MNDMLKEIRLGLERFWKLSWWIRGPVLAIIALFVIGGIRSLASSGGSNSTVQSLPTASTTAPATTVAPENVAFWDSVKSEFVSGFEDRSQGQCFWQIVEPAILVEFTNSDITLAATGNANIAKQMFDFAFAYGRDHSAEMVAQCGAPVTQPPVTQPPVTQPPVTQPPVTQPPPPTPAPTAVKLPGMGALVTDWDNTHQVDPAVSGGSAYLPKISQGGDTWYGVQKNQGRVSGFTFNLDDPGEPAAAAELYASEWILPGDAHQVYSITLDATNGLSGCRFEQFQSPTLGSLFADPQIGDAQGLVDLELFNGLNPSPSFDADHVDTKGVCGYQDGGLACLDSSQQPANLAPDETAKGSPDRHALPRGWQSRGNRRLLESRRPVEAPPIRWQFRAG